MAVSILEFEKPFWVRPGEFADADSLGESLLEKYEDFVVPLDSGEYDLSDHTPVPYISMLTVSRAGRAVLHFISKEVTSTELASMANGHRLEPTSVLDPLLVDENHRLLVCSERDEASGATLVHIVITYNEF